MIFLFFSQARMQFDADLPVSKKTSISAFARFYANSSKVNYLKYILNHQCRKQLISYYIQFLFAFTVQESGYSSHKLYHDRQHWEQFLIGVGIAWTLSSCPWEICCHTLHHPQLSHGREHCEQFLRGCGIAWTLSSCPWELCSTLRSWGGVELWRKPWNWFSFWKYRFWKWYVLFF